MYKLLLLFLFINVAFSINTYSKRIHELSFSSSYNHTFIVRFMKEGRSIETKYFDSRPQLIVKLDYLLDDANYLLVENRPIKNDTNMLSYFNVRILFDDKTTVLKTVPWFGSQTLRIDSVKSSNFQYQSSILEKNIDHVIYGVVKIIKGFMISV